MKKVLMRDIPEYHTWMHIKQRCYNKNNNRYYLYGGRGIVVCEKWKNNFEEFYKDMGKKPTSKHSIDRIDSNGNYEPSNCRWATAVEQAQNRGIRSDNISGFIGVRYHKYTKKWQARKVVNGIRISLGYFDSAKEASNRYKEVQYGN